MCAPTAEEAARVASGFVADAAWVLARTPGTDRVGALARQLEEEAGEVR